ncbi:MAG: AAA family ATPase, partial [Planctomycetota bacterium]
HISWLLRTPETVYKIKRPVRLDFLDYTDPATRRHYCQRELELNRRLSEGVYLGLVPVYRDQTGHYRLGGEGQEVDTAVHMRRLADERTAEAMLERGELDHRAIDAIAARLASFHRGSSRDRRGHNRPGHRIAGLLQTTVSCRRAGRDLLPPADLDLVTAAQKGFCRDARRLLAKRYASGHCRNGHGDLRLEHIYFDGGIQIIDAIEFDPGLRYSDVADDLGFLVMDLVHHGRPDLASYLLSRYCLYGNDYDFLRLLDGFACHRALVRCLVACLAAKDDTMDTGKREAKTEEATRYLATAKLLTRPRRNRPRLIVLCGMIGSGKSTIAHLLEQHGTITVNSDRTRKYLAGLDPHQRGGPELYSQRQTERTYAAMFERADAILASGRDAVCDASFAQRHWRLRALHCAAARRARLLVLHVQCPRPELRRRLSARQGDVSDADTDLLDRFTASFQPPHGDEAHAVHAMDSTAPHTDLHRELTAILEEDRTS